MNSVHVLHAYLTLPGLWVFDDAHFDLKAEAFVCGTSEAIDRVLAKKYPGQKPERCCIIASAAPMPDADLIATVGGEPQRHTAVRTGALYYPDDGSENFWLCPALCHYFGPVAPAKIYATIRLAA